MSDDLIDLPLGEDEGEPVFPTDEPSRPTVAAQRRRPPSRRRRHRRPPWRWILPLSILIVIAGWLYWRPPKLEVRPGEPAPAVAAVGESSDPIEVEFHNPGRRRVLIEDIRLVGADGFSIGRRDCGDEIPAGESCRVQVALVPQSMGNVKTSLEVVGSQRGGVSSLTLTGEGLGAHLDSDPAQLDFGTAPVEGESAPQRLRIRNLGTLAGTVGRVSIDSREFRLVANECRSALDPGQECSLQVAFRPLAMGERTARLRADGEVAQPLEVVELVGRGTGPGFEIRPARLDFGQQKVGTDSSPIEVSWLNQGDRAWSVGTPVLEGQDFRLVSDTCARSPVPVNGSCSARVTFAPTKAGPATASLQLVHRSGERFPPAELSGTGTAPRLAFDLRSVGFPATPVGRSSPPRSVRLNNNGTAEAEIVGVRVDGPGAASIALESDCGSRLAVGATCVLQLQLAPRTAGEVTASLAVRSDDPASPLQLPLAGNGSSPRMVLSRSRLDFATVPQGESQDLQLAIENPGTAALEIMSVAIDGSGFALRGDDCSGRMVVAGGDCSLLIRFQPGAPGAHVGSVEITSAVGDERVSLSGLAGDPPIPRVALSPANIRFDPTPSGGRSPVETVTVTSFGPGQLSIQSVSIDGPGAEAFRLVPATCADLSQLVAGSSCSIGIRFQPAAQGTHQAGLVVRGSGEPAVLRVDLSGDTSP